jgi:hypothetical protein
MKIKYFFRGNVIADFQAIDGIFFFLAFYISGSIPYAEAYSVYYIR